MFQISGNFIKMAESEAKFSQKQFFTEKLPCYLYNKSITEALHKELCFFLIMRLRFLKYKLTLA